MWGVFSGLKGAVRSGERAHRNDSKAAALRWRMGKYNDWAPRSFPQRLLEPAHLLLINVHLMSAAQQNPILQDSALALGRSGRSIPLAFQRSVPLSYL